MYHDLLGWETNLFYYKDYKVLAKSSFRTWPIYLTDKLRRLKRSLLRHFAVDNWY